MTATIVTEGRGELAIRIDGVASAAAGGQGEIANPEGVDLIIMRTTLVVHTASTGAANITIGVGASGASVTDIINALAMNGVSAQTVYNGHARQNTDKTEVSAPALWTSGLFIVITGSATMVGLEATLLVEYLRVDEPS